MKFLAIFLSVIILAMAFDICADTDACGDKDKTGLIKTTEQQPEDAGICGPFCHCLRCPFSVLLPNESCGLPNGNSVQKQYTHKSESLYLSVQNAVWQPPKIA